MWNYILAALGWVIKIIYDVCHNYGVAIILFTVVIKLLLLPLNIKSQRAMKKQQMIQPIIAELQQKYANDQQKLQQEMMKVYRENNVSMMGGCLPVLLQMPILIALYQVIRQPISFIKGAFNADWGYISNTIQSVADGANITIKAEEIGTWWNQNQMQIAKWAEKSGHEWSINFDFLGLDLSRYPSDAFAYLSDVGNHLSTVLLLLIPVLAVVSSILQSKISMNLNGQNKDKNKKVNDQAQSTSKMMMWMMPIMTGFFAITLPAGMGLYWIASGVVQIIQQYALNIYFEKKGEDFDIKVPEKKQYNGKKSKKR